MPCWMQVRTELDFGAKPPNQDLLAAALRDIGFHVNTPEYSAIRGYAFSADHYARRLSVSIDAQGRVEIGGPAGSSVDTQNEVRRAYGAQAVKQAAKRFGWSLAPKEANRFVLTRRT